MAVDILTVCLPRHLQYVRKLFSNNTLAAVSNAEAVFSFEIISLTRLTSCGSILGILHLLNHSKENTQFSSATWEYVCCFGVIL